QRHMRPTPRGDSSPEARENYGGYSSNLIILEQSCRHEDTKIGKIRIVPLPAIVKNDMLALAAQNSHGPDGFLMFGTKEDAPLDCHALERGFDKALIRLFLGDKYAKSTKKEKKRPSKTGERTESHSIRFAITQILDYGALYQLRRCAN
ncbi:MAG: hypothetical protein ABFC86_07990, partial [Rectinema sp.]